MQHVREYFYFFTFFPILIYEPINRPQYEFSGSWYEQFEIWMSLHCMSDNLYSLQCDVYWHAQKFTTPFYTNHHHLHKKLHEQYSYKWFVLVVKQKSRIANFWWVIYKKKKRVFFSDFIVLLRSWLTRSWLI